MKRHEWRLLLKAMKGDADAREQLERIADDDARWSRWPRLKMAANAGLAVLAAGTGLAAAVKTVYVYLKDSQP